MQKLTIFLCCCLLYECGCMDAEPVAMARPAAIKKNRRLSLKEERLLKTPGAFYTKTYGPTRSCCSQQDGQVKVQA